MRFQTKYRDDEHRIRANVHAPEGGVTTKDECIAAAGRALAEAHARREALTPRAAAEAAHRPGGPSVDELERRIREDRQAAFEQAS